MKTKYAIVIFGTANFCLLHIQDFERKSALFSLATAEVLIINMFEQTVGLYNGANMSLLRTVLEVNLQLFQVDS